LLLPLRLSATAARMRSFKAASSTLRYVKSRLSGNAAAGNAYNVADMASLLQAVRNAGANNMVILAPGVLERLLAVVWPW
jgi:hypothetical protein